MGYYDNQQVANLTGRNAPYDVKDILLGTNAVTGGVDKLVANAAAERVSSQQDQANQYISSLLRNTNTDNYDTNMAQMRTLLPYATPQMQAQASALTTDINNKNNLAIAQQRANADTDNVLINKQNADTNATSVENTRKHYDDEYMIKDKELNQKADEFKTQKEWQQFAFTHLSSEQRAQLGIEASRLKISEKELYLRAQQVHNESYVPVTLKDYATVDGKPLITGEHVITVNRRTGQSVGLGASSVNNVDTLSKSLIPTNNTTQTIIPKSMPIGTYNTPISTNDDYSKSLYQKTSRFGPNQDIIDLLNGN